MVTFEVGIVRGEMIGREVRVVGAKNNALCGIEGTVLDETKNSLLIETSSGRKTILKRQVILEFVHQGRIVRLRGEAIEKRPEDRIKLGT